MKYSTKLTSIILSLIMLLTMVPVPAFAEELSSSEAAADGTAAESVTVNAYGETTADAANAEPGEDGETQADAADAETGEDAEAEADDPDEDNDGSEAGYEELIFSEGTDPDAIENADPEQLMDEFLFSYDAGEDIGMAPPMPLSVKGDRLTGVDLIFYNNYKKIITEVAAGSRTNTSYSVKLSKLLGKRKFTAKELGVKKIGYKKNGRWYVTAAAQNKIREMLTPKDWKKVYQSLLSDYSSEGYWIDWYSSEQFALWNCIFRFDAKSLTFKSSDTITFRLPVINEFRMAGNSSYKIDAAKVNSAKEARANAAAIVRAFDESIPTALAGYSPDAIDYYRLWYYCEAIAKLTEYDTNSVNLSEWERYWRGPWSLIYVFDNDPQTNTVCAGYVRAFKYLCELSTFESDWIDCQLVTGSAGPGENGNHMWNIVRMNDGENYVVDPTWIDEGSSADITKWFLRGDPYGTADSFTIEDNTRVYDEWTRTTYPYAERKLSTKSRYELTSDRPITPQGTAVRKLIKAKKGFTVRWKKVVTPLGAMYIDGYQIQYSTKKNMKKARTVTVKGFESSSVKIKKVKRKKKYYVRIRTYVKAGRKTYYSDWSTAKKVKTK